MNGSILGVDFRVVAVVCLNVRKVPAHLLGCIKDSVFRWRTVNQVRNLT